ncbi:hypothetical protein F5X68DRAFT_197003 [Plectosphaerella plurivora]|uniref:Uncharacterized protein n=1 Tax=Plectosphaerella plurivora TaxID=936078 RepID=A0A9P8VPB1_9PEZI|nr:hypothetical protein F5X68DRAFT_197003 [Plectosphaerella plurivora]
MLSRSVTFVVDNAVVEAKRRGGGHGLSFLGCLGHDDAGSGEALFGIELSLPSIEMDFRGVVGHFAPVHRVVEVAVDCSSVVLQVRSCRMTATATTPADYVIPQSCPATESAPRWLRQHLIAMQRPGLRASLHSESRALPRQLFHSAYLLS